MKAESARVAVSVATTLALLVVAVCARAHHSFSAEFDIGRPVELTGTVTDIEWTNPHAWIHMEVLSDSSNRALWAIEMLGINSLVHSGITPRTVRAGDVLTVTGFGARNGTNTANASSVTRTETGERLWSSAGDSE
jgi:hypothetical protein